MGCTGYLLKHKLPATIAPMRWVTQLNVRLDDDTDSDLTREAEKAGSTRSQIAREAIKKELERRKRARRLERDLELLESHA